MGEIFEVARFAADTRLGIFEGALLARKRQTTNYDRLSYFGRLG